MKYKLENGKIHLVLEVGEDVGESLLKLAEAENIKSASLTGIGALGDPIIGYFDVEAGDYLQKRFPGSWELVSLNGSIAWSEGKPIAHLHVALGGPDFTVRAGHLFEGRVSVTGEIFITLNETMLERTEDEKFGLKLIDMN